MSYHGIEVKQFFRVQCLNCNYDATYETAGIAEQAARDHIEAWVETGESEGAINYHHAAQITESVKVGRQL